MNNYSNIIQRTIIRVFMISWLILPGSSHAQDSIGLADLQKYSYSFDIKNGSFIGPGAELLTEAIKDVQILMLGNNSRNQMESDLDLALSAVLNENKFNHLIMEIGPASGTISNHLAKASDETIQKFKSLNQKYHFEEGELLFMPIPDFKYLGTAKLLQYVKEQNWSFSGIGVDSWTGYQMIIDELFQRLSQQKQKELNQNYKSTSKLLDQLYGGIKGQSTDDLKKLISGLKASEDFAALISAFEEIYSAKRMLESLQFSLDFWDMYGNKKYFEKNELNYKRNKVLLREALGKSNFDFEEDKLFLKMWRGHLTKGTTPNGFYGVGNTLMELAAYHEKSSLTIAVIERYTKKDNEVIDVLESDAYIFAPNKIFTPLGKKNDWILVDLRPFNKEFHWGNFIMTLDMQKMINSYDMIIIPKTDYKAVINY